MPTPTISDPIRDRAFVGFARASAALIGLVAVIEVFVRGPLAPQTLATGVVAVVFAGLLVVHRRFRATAVFAATGIGVYAAGCIYLEHTTATDQTTLQVVMYCFPVAATLLANRLMGGVFLAIAATDSAVRLVANGRLDDPTAIVSVVARLFVGGALVVLAWIFDRERLAASRLAASREEGLLEAVARAECAAAARTQFLANMSHEIRTPMNGVLGLSRVLAEEPLTASQHSLAKTILDSGQSLLHILDDILDVSKMDAGALQIDPRPTAMAELATQVVSLMRSRAEEIGIRLELEVDSSVPDSLLVDGHRVRQVMTNLIGNAIKFTHEGYVRVELSHAADRLRVSVSDSGIGIDEQALPRLFESFEQAEAGTARRYGGTGLGLAICQRLCRLMGGSVAATSQLGVGSTFVFDIEAPPTQVAADNGRERECIRHVPLRVLVAEDTRVNQVVMRHFLSKLGAEAMIVNDGAAAVSAVAAEDFDVVLMDLQMPDIDGLEATRRIRRLPDARREVPVVALTASVMKEQRNACFEAGMTDVLTKPIELEVLSASLSRIWQANAIGGHTSPSNDQQGLESHPDEGGVSRFLGAADTSKVEPSTT